MDAPGGGVIHGVLDGIAQDAQGLQTVSDTQASLVKSLGATLEGLGSTMLGAAGTAMQQVGEQLINQGNQLSTHFDEHSHKMKNNGQILQSGDEDGAHMIAQVANMMA
jgi:hypothetical protein